ncbi:MAG: diguanylate cyclase, partial [Bacilli bacterium]
MNNLYYLIFLANEEVNNDLPSGLNIVISIFVVGALAFLSYLLIKSVLKERTKYVEENSVILEGTLSKSAINSYITGYIAKIGKDNSFSLIYIELDNLTEIDDAFGSKEATIVVMKLMKMILEILPKSSKLSKYSKDSFLAF